MTLAQSNETALLTGPRTARRLLSRGNTKANKGIGRGFLTWTLMLAPNTTSGYSVCPGATLGCEATCPGITGRQRMGAVMNAHVENTKILFEQRLLFLARLHEELDALERTAERRGLVPCARLNNFSDLDWSAVAASHPRIQFYDFTKREDLMKRFLRNEQWSRNYHLTFSRSETNWEQCLEMLDAGGNVAVVFRRLDVAPSRWRGFNVIGALGDDLRFLDPRSNPGNIVALKSTPEGRRDKTGFVADLQA